ncbi:hypothetical protein HELRODRAFT_174226 [Helobdella robusta]|uniref:Uncharacterized protein n=1 Tax=Helobdella robusta TaxID=6412 RepID=T1F7U3_HELRO|nr:hypothetical protein HELRODRAFT_174226 [Helobdella robusta]ESO02807.1 hypothetical protein HELRODRAFT_174226 [Helobdella robusta]
MIFDCDTLISHLRCTCCRGLVEKESYRNNKAVKNFQEVNCDKDMETFDMQRDYQSDLAASNSLDFLSNSDNGDIMVNDVFEIDAGANDHSGHELVTDDDSSFQITPPTSSWKKSLIFFYLDDNINDGFIADENEFCIAASLIDKKYVNNNYNMHQSYRSGHFTPCKLNRKNMTCLLLEEPEQRKRGVRQK